MTPQKKYRSIRKDIPVRRDIIEEARRVLPVETPDTKIVEAGLRRLIAEFGGPRKFAKAQEVV